MNIILPTLGKDRQKTYSPFLPICPETGHVLEIPVIEIDKSNSKIVFDNFKPMIPSDFHDLWKKGIDSESYFLKLCGSGGGGYILGFAPDIDKAKNDLKNYNLEVVYHF